MEDKINDPLWIAKMQSGIELTESQGIIWEVMDECRDHEDLINQFSVLEKGDLIAALMAYEARIQFGVDPFPVFRLLIESGCTDERQILKDSEKCGDLLSEIFYSQETIQ